MLEDLAGGEGRAVSADDDGGVRQAGACHLGEVEDLRDVREVVAREDDRVWPPPVEQTEVVRVCLGLEIDEPDVVAGAPGGRRNELESEGLETQEDLRVHQPAGMNREHAHPVGTPEAQLPVKLISAAERTLPRPAVRLSGGLRLRPVLGSPGGVQSTTLAQPAIAQYPTAASARSSCSSVEP